MRTIIYPGSFDPITVGHLDIMERTKKAFPLHKFIIIVANNRDKQHMFSIEERVEFVKQSIEHLENTEVIAYEGVISDYINENKIPLMVRGLRNSVDMNYEREQEEFTNETTDCSTIYFQTSTEHTNISSSLVRKFIKFGYKNKIKYMVTDKIYQTLSNKTVI